MDLSDPHLTIGQYKARTADCGLRTTDCGLGIKHGLGIKRGLRTGYGIKYGLRTTLVKAVLIGSR